MATNINTAYTTLQYRANKSGFLGNISPNDFNLIFPRAEIKYYNQLYSNYYKTQRVSDALSRFFSDATTITMQTTGNTAGQYVFPSDMYHIDSLTHLVSAIQYPVQRVEKDRLANHLSSQIEAPSDTFPIYTQYKTFIQFYPLTLANAILVYLKAPSTSVWGFTINGIASYGTLVGGSAYTTGTYTGVALTGGSGLSATATIIVAGGVVTTVTIVSPGKNYVVGNILSATAATIGGSGSGFSITVTAIGVNRPIYDSSASTQPQWDDFDMDNILNLSLQDVAQNMIDNNLQQFAQIQTREAR